MHAAAEKGGRIFYGTVNRFFTGDPSAGDFMSGYIAVFRFGLPAACLAMYRSAAPERRAVVGGRLLSMALTSFRTGVAEPVEFSVSAGLFDCLLNMRAGLHRSGPVSADVIVKLKVDSPPLPSTARPETGASRLPEQTVAALEALGVRAVARLKDGATQLPLGPATVPVYGAVRATIEG